MFIQLDKYTYSLENMTKPDFGRVEICSLIATNQINYPALISVQQFFWGTETLSLTDADQRYNMRRTEIRSHKVQRRIYLAERLKPL